MSTSCGNNQTMLTGTLLAFLVTVLPALPTTSSIIQAQTASGETTHKGAARVLIGGNASSPQYYQEVVDRVADFLTSRGVAAKQLDPGKSRDSYLEQLAAADADSLLYVVVDIQVGQMKDKVTVDCFDRQGKRLWREEAGSFFRGTPKRLANSIAKKLESHLGKEGLPVGPK